MLLHLGTQGTGVLPVLQGIIKDSVDASNTAIQNLNVNTQKLKDALESRQGLFRGDNFIERLNNLGNAVIDAMKAPIALAKLVRGVMGGIVSKVDSWENICFDCMKPPAQRTGRIKDWCDTRSFMKDDCKRKFGVTWNY
jgi:hypothetical protein